MTGPQPTAATVIAIDGPVGSGKSTVSKAVARRLGLDHLDTGAMYRAAAVAVMRRNLDPEAASAAELVEVVRHVVIEADDRVLLDGDDITDLLRIPEVGRAVSTVAACAEVRTELVRRQRAWAAEHGGGVVEGRDIASVVFPDATLKVFLTASDEERARRRSSDEDPAALARRDRLDSTRATSPLTVADDAWVLDTTGRSIDDIVDDIVARVPAAEAPPDEPSPPASSTRPPEGPSGPLSGVTGPSGPLSGVTGPSGPLSGVTGPSGPLSGVTGPSGPLSGVTAREGPLRDQTDPAVTGPPTGAARVLYGAVRVLVNGICRTYWRATYEGLEHIPSTGAFILAPVHRSFIDFGLVAAVSKRRIRYMGKDSLWKVSWFGSFISALGAFPVRRGAADREALRRCLAIIRSGEPLVLFPEGTRRSGPAVHDLYEGAAYVAIRAGVPIVPIGIGGSERALEKGKRLPRPVKVHVVVGAPLVPPPPKASGHPSRSALRELTAALHSEVQRLFDQAQAKA